MFARSIFGMLLLLWMGAQPVSSQEKPAKTGEQLPLLSPEESWKSLRTAEDLAIDLVLHEPTVAQPVFLNFDERGRMWVVQYLQYPQPAGVKVLSHDKFWRAVYDRVPPPPPKHVRGADKITIHEDTNGDGTFDKHTTFLDGLNICTAVCCGRGGAWVLNPPYLLFYPDRDQNDIPDSDPEIHLAGFGLEDTHSVVNSLCWGPDGWLYAAQGSTVTGDVLRPTLDKQPLHSLGQLIWRYHPEKKKYEIFSEGGGNAFCCEIDSQGRIFSGHNGGDTRGFHYMQGAYLQKGFNKHGPLSNPYAFGYFPAMKHAAVQRFTHAFAIYEAEALPQQYWHKIFGVAPLLNYVSLSEKIPHGSTYETKDVAFPVQASDRCFRPTDIKLGPEGALYIADWYDSQIAHLRIADTKFDNSTGRIYRLRAKQSKLSQMPDLSHDSPTRLVDRLRDSNRTIRQLALRLLYDRHDASLVPTLNTYLQQNEVGQRSLETLWAMHASGGWNEETERIAFNHAEPQVRLWGARLACDDGAVSAAMARRLAELARTEPEIEVRSQLACSAKRLPADLSLPIMRELLCRAEDATDARQPLLCWWAIEAKCGNNREQVLSLFASSTLWQQPLVQQQIISRLIQRFAAAGKQEDFLTCAKLFALAPDKASSQQLMAGFEQAFRGKAVPRLPKALVAELARAGGGSLSLRVRQLQADSLVEAVATIGNEKHAAEERVELIQLLGEVKHLPAMPVLLKLASSTTEAGEVRQAAIAALAPFEGENIARSLLAAYAQLPADSQGEVQQLLIGRAEWTRELLAAVERKSIAPAEIPQEIVRHMLFFPAADIAASVKKHWGSVEGATSEAMRAQIVRFEGLIRGGEGDPYRGDLLYRESCGKCHKLYGVGGDIGPDLTADKRDDLTRMLLHIVNPNAEIREGFEPYLIQTQAGRLLQGFLAEQNAEEILLRGVDGRTTLIPRQEIEEMQRSPRSLMPEGLLNAYSEQQLRDLFAYLRMTQPLVK